MRAVVEKRERVGHRKVGVTLVTGTQCLKPLSFQLENRVLESDKKKKRSSESRVGEKSSSLKVQQGVEN